MSGKMEQYYIGIDVGGTKVYGGLVSPSGAIVATHKEATPPRASAREVMAVIARVVKALLGKAEVRRSQILGLGVAVPGVVDNDGRVVVTPNIDLGGTDLRRQLQKAYQVRVVVGNDVNLGVLGEKWLGAGRQAMDIVGIFPGTGVGGGVIARGQFLTGSQGAAGEIGHMVVDPRGPACTCGNAGCLEAVAGRWAIERDIRAAVKRGDRSLITELAGRKLSPIKSGALAKALKAKDPLVTRVMGRAADALAAACVSLNHIFNPEMFILGGGVVEACGEFILPRIERALKKDPFFRELRSPRVEAAKLGDDAVMLGAVAAVRGGHESGASYYPKLKMTPGGRIMVHATAIDRPVYLRADGKLRDPDEFVPPQITQDLAEELARKGPETLFIALGRGKRLVFTPKAARALRKKHIVTRVLPAADALKAYNACAQRKAVFFYP